MFPAWLRATDKRIYANTLACPRKRLDTQVWIQPTWRGPPSLASLGPLLQAPTAN